MLARFDAIYTSTYNDLITDNLNYSSHQNTIRIYHANWNYRGAIDAARAKGGAAGVSIIEDLMAGVDVLLGDAVPLGGGNAGYLGWPSTVVPYNNPPRDVEGTPLHEMIFFKEVCYLLITIRMDATLWADQTKQDWYNETLSFVRLHVFEKWLQNTTQNGGFNFRRSRTHMASHSAAMVYQLYLMTQQQDQTMLDITQDICFDGMPVHADGNIRDNLTAGYDAVNNRYVWNMTWPSASNQQVQDSNHGHHLLQSLILLLEMQFHFIEDDFIRFANTWDQLAVNSYTTYSDYRNIDRSGGATSLTGTRQGACTIARFNANLGNGLDANVAAHDDGDKFWSGSLAYQRIIQEQGRPPMPSHWPIADGPFDFGVGTETPPDQATLPLSRRRQNEMFFAIN